MNCGTEVRRIRRWTYIGNPAGRRDRHGSLLSTCCPSAALLPHPLPMLWSTSLTLALNGASANGTYIGANPASASADFINYQVGGTTKFKVDLNGVITGNGSGLTGISGALSGLNTGDVMFAASGTTAGTTETSPGTIRTIR